MQLRHLFLCLIATCALGLGLRADPVLAGHPALAGQSLDDDAIKAVLLGKRITLGDTRLVIVIAKSSDTQDAFLKAHLGMTTSQFQNHWRRLFMTGGGTAPKIVDDEASASALLASTPGAVAVLDQNSAATLATLSH